LPHQCHRTKQVSLEIAVRGKQIRVYGQAMALYDVTFYQDYFH
jgi:hypothetical protein